MAAPTSPTEQERKLLSREQDYETRDWCRRLDRSEDQMRRALVATAPDARPPAGAALERRG